MNLKVSRLNKSLRFLPSCPVIEGTLTWRGHRTWVSHGAILSNLKHQNVNFALQPITGPGQDPKISSCSIEEVLWGLRPRPDYNYSPPGVLPDGCKILFFLLVDVLLSICSVHPLAFVKVHHVILWSLAWTSVHPAVSHRNEIDQEQR